MAFMCILFTLPMTCFVQILELYDMVPGVISDEGALYLVWPVHQVLLW